MRTMRNQAEPPKSERPDKALGRKYRLTDVTSLPGYQWATTRWLRRQVYEGQLPSYKVAGYVLLDLDDLDALVEAGRRSA